jgi:hypothetical protein
MLLERVFMQQILFWTLLTIFNVLYTDIYLPSLTPHLKLVIYLHN